MSKSVEGYLLIADITGYTWYLSESELEHAQDTLTELLEILVDQTRPPLVISRLAGDAVISYCLLNNVLQGQTFIELIEDTYVAFRNAIELMIMNNTCQCNACANVSKLDLKFFLHFGSFGIQQIADHDELVGSEVNRLHRLLKNNVTEKSGIAAYVLYTDAAITKLNMEDFQESLIPHKEEYGHLGPVSVWIQDLLPVWESRRKEMEVKIPKDEINIEISTVLELPPEQLWDYIIQPEFRNTLTGSDRMEIVNRDRGRIGTGSIYQCYHGDKIVPVTILTWQPFTRIVISQPFPMARSSTMMGEYRLEPSNEGTRLTIRSSKPAGSFWGGLVYSLMRPLLSRNSGQMLEAFRQQVENDFKANRQGMEQPSTLDKQSFREAAVEGLQASTNVSGP